nr:putative ribonuclease H-like domain-containing protein [Tanacetum cinerariifolium]
MASCYTGYTDRNGSVLFTDSECMVLGRDFKLKDDTNVLLRTPRQHSMYSIDLNNIVLHNDLTYLVAKASANESMLLHRRLGHLNFKTWNKLVRHNLVKSLPSKCFENDHTCTACLEGKQHKASCKSKLVNSVSKPLHTLHMNLFGPTSVSSLNHKWCDNRGKFRNKEVNNFYSRKGIKREFDNARTPQQNGVAERINRTLIEAARTMLTDAKHPVTFWAEAVNTAYYVQNRVLVNKSQNKTPYELFNGRTPAIGFLKPFGCHVMILNTLDHFGKFDANRDEGYFIGYSMSSKAFRVFNKRTKKVEENLHADFLENKVIEKGAGPNLLFDIDSLTNSINYVPVVVTGTSSTNFSTCLESSTSNAQDACNVDASESSGNSNPTATSTNPSADHMEKLTVETPIPTVSSPVPTACLDDSLQPSSDSRLISKRVTSQDDTPSLDNILTLSNRFDDILGVTTNTSDTNGMEADLGNMENNISASPTPTFRIHKDHPKSQIIGHEEPKKISDALKDPSWVEAMQEELLQFKIQNVWILVDCPEGKKDDIFLSQDKYIGDILKKFGYLDVRLANTPMDKENPWGKDGTGKDVDLHLYRSMIGSFMYLTASRRDIMFAVCACARHQVTPKECHMHAVKRIFRYLKGHPKLGLWYPKESPFDLVAYSDSDYGGATQDRKSTTGGCQFLGRRLISWKCKKHTIVATSIAEAEYVAAASGCGQVLWI